MASKNNQECVRVIVRARPFVPLEKKKKCKSIVKVENSNNAIVLKDPSSGYSKSF